VRMALDAATLNPADKTVDVFVAVGGDHTANAGSDRPPTMQSCSVLNLSLLSIAVTRIQ
jgi:hypothetical protein